VRFDARFPVHSQSVTSDGRTAQVILGADDKHLAFRTCVAVRILDDGAVAFSMANRVACTNAFGRIYMALIASTHRRVVAPAMLVHAVDAALRSVHRLDESFAHDGRSHSGSPYTGFTPVP
jgi:hypothetical protein